MKGFVAKIIFAAWLLYVVPAASGEFVLAGDAEDPDRRRQFMEMLDSIKGLDPSNPVLDFEKKAREDGYVGDVGIDFSEHMQLAGSYDIYTGLMTINSLRMYDHDQHGSHYVRLPDGSLDLCRHDISYPRDMVLVHELTHALNWQKDNVVAALSKVLAQSRSARYSILAELVDEAAAHVNHCRYKRRREKADPARVLKFRGMPKPDPFDYMNADMFFEDVEAWHLAQLSGSAIDIERRIYTDLYAYIFKSWTYYMQAISNANRLRKNVDCCYDQSSMASRSLLDEFIRRTAPAGIDLPSAAELDAAMNGIVDRLAYYYDDLRGASGGFSIEFINDVLPRVKPVAGADHERTASFARFGSINDEITDDERKIASSVILERMPQKYGSMIFPNFSKSAER
jgi:hypothetical protein